MKAFRPIVFLFAFFSTSQVYSQYNIYLPQGHGKGIESNKLVAGISQGVSYVNNNNLNHWLESYGLTSVSVPVYNTDLSLFFGVGKFVSGLEMGLVYSSSRDLNFNGANMGIMFGKAYKLNHSKAFNTLLIPSVMIGWGGEGFSFGSNVPLPITQLNVPNGSLEEQYLYLKPNVKLLHRVKGSFFVQFEMGLKTYPYRATWHDGHPSTSSNYNNSVMVNASFIPKISAFSPYVSIFIGFGKWKKH